MKTVELSVKGMTCSNCARHVGEALRSVRGVENAAVNLQENAATVRWAPESREDVPALLAAVAEAGYEASLREGTKPKSFLEGWFFNVLVGGLATALLMLLEWGFGAGMKPWYRWFSFAIALPIQVLCGARFYQGAWNQLKRGSSNMDTLVALGSTTAFVYSAAALFRGTHEHVFFMESVSIIALISIGHWLETKASARAESSFRALLRLAPDQARRITPSGVEELVPVSQLRPGDVVQVKPGDRVPIDAVVMDGSSSVDESMLTGESLPVEKQAGSKVFAGTLNEDGTLRLRVESIGEQTALAQIAQLVQSAQSSRAEIQRLGDKISSVFVPIVLVIAAGTAFFWGFAPEMGYRLAQYLEPFLWKIHPGDSVWGDAIYRTASVLIIACPCAMGLATPIAIMAGTNAAARRGILIRNGSTLEKSGQITAVVFDKTGTLTQGKIALAEVFRVDSSIDTVRFAASLAAPSNHPLSRAMAAQSEVRVPLQKWAELRGSGIRAELSGLEWRLGSLRWIKEGVSFNSESERFAIEWASKGASVVALSAGPELKALFALRDALKPGAEQIVAALRAKGKKVFLLSGDQTTAARAVAHEAGIPAECVFAEVQPGGKVDVIKRLQSQGENVAFVGDGINDAPALEQANLGIAVSAASDVAREAADILLLNTDIASIPESLALAEATLRTIKQNLFWAFFYNAVGIPLAALGFMSPILSAAAMGLSDLIVIGNALRLFKSGTKRVAS